MKDQKDYTEDIAEIRSMMERSTKFLSLSGWVGIMAGLYALTGTYIAYTYFHFHPAEILYTPEEIENAFPDLQKVIWSAVTVLGLAFGTAVVLSFRKAETRGEKIWNAASRRLMVNLTVPLAVGAVLLLIFLAKGLIGLIAPLSLIFYGLALYNASKFTYDEVKILGMLQIGLGLIAAYVIEYSLILWALGFGIVHIAYGIYLHFKYER